MIALICVGLELLFISCINKNLNGLSVAEERIHELEDKCLKTVQKKKEVEEEKRESRTSIVLEWI